jgi:RNA polymerase sigma-70 factor, ECF subfamily
MIRISRTNQSPAAARLIVEGQLTGKIERELRESFEDARADDREVEIDVAGVTFVDNDGAKVVRELSKRGATISGACAFLRELLRDGHHNGAGAHDDDGDLVRRLRDGDEEAFETMVRRHGGRMVAVARRFLPVEQDANDAVQEAFISAFKAIHNFNGEARLSTWLHRIVVNAALMQLRSRRRRAEESIDNLLPRFDEEGKWADETMRFIRTEDVSLERSDTRAMVRKCIDQLPDNYRTVLLMRDIEELDTDQVAKMLGATPNTVKVRLHRARQALRAILEREVLASGEVLAHADARAERRV